MNGEATTRTVAFRAKRWRAAQEKADAIRDDVVDAVRWANDGGASEYELAKAAGVSRQTIRAWLGK